jgi:acetoin utilization protein AcuB
MTLDKDVPISSYMTRNTRTIRHDADLGTARKLMHDNNIRHLPVLDAKKLVGVLSERDVHLARAVLGEKADASAVEDVCAPVPYAVSKDVPISQVAHEMAEERYGSAIIIDEKNEVVGIFTTTDACRALSAAFEI